MKGCLMYIILLVVIFCIAAGCSIIMDGSSEDDNGKSFSEDMAAMEQADKAKDEAAYYESLQEELFEDAINWEDAKDHVGEYVKIAGYVTNVSRPGTSGDPIFVDVGGDYPNDRVTGVCWEEYHSQFPDIEDCKGKVIKMEGTIYEYKGMPNIELTDSFQIEVMY